MMRLTPRQLQTTAPHPLVTMVRCMGPYNPQNPVRPSVRPSVRRPSARPPSVRPSYYYPNWGVCVTPQPPKTPSNSEGGWLFLGGRAVPRDPRSCCCCFSSIFGFCDSSVEKVYKTHPKSCKN